VTPIFSLYLVRHGAAEPRGDRWPDDAVRPLSEEGTARMRRAARGLASLGEPIGIVLTSPLVRAVQTAEILRHALGIGPAVETCPPLAPGGRPREVAAAVRAHGLSGTFALVGHEPDLGQLAGWFVGAKAPVPFKKGAVGRIDIAGWPPAGRGQLVWLLPPKILRRL
jgi:phosphohistidine phosphatase